MHYIFRKRVIYYEVYMIADDKLFIARCIRKARVKMNMTQAEFAEKIDISAQQVSRIETASYIPSLPTFFKIAKVLNLSLRDFGIFVEETNSTYRDELLKTIYMADEDDIRLLYDLVEVIIKHSHLIK